MQYQSQFSKLAEIAYRKKIASQHLGKKIEYENEPTAAEFKKILSLKLKDTQKKFKDLQKKGLVKSLFLEIGAEYSLRSSLLASKFNVQGISCDISLYSLSKSKQFAKKFGYKKTPKLICADAYSLPFKSNSFPFVFVYETLHHFPDPSPALAEIKRVMTPGGACFIGSEPVKQGFQLKLWRRPNKLRLWEKFLKLTLILPYISYIGKTEVEHGILEETFPLKTWRKALKIFEDVDATVKPYPIGPKSSNLLNLSFATRVLLHIGGGAIEAICKKNTGTKKGVIGNANHLLICPNCLKKKSGEIPLTNLSCKNCKTSYKTKLGIPILIDTQTAKNIFFESTEKDP